MNNREFAIHSRGNSPIKQPLTKFSSRKRNRQKRSKKDRVKNRYLQNELDMHFIRENEDHFNQDYRGAVFNEEHHFSQENLSFREENNRGSFFNRDDQDFDFNEKYRGERFTQGDRFRRDKQDTHFRQKQFIQKIIYNNLIQIFPEHINQSNNNKLHQCLQTNLQNNVNFPNLKLKLQKRAQKKKKKKQKISKRHCSASFGLYSSWYHHDTRTATAEIEVENHFVEFNNRQTQFNEDNRKMHLIENNGKADSAEHDPDMYFVQEDSHLYLQSNIPPNLNQSNAFGIDWGLQTKNNRNGKEAKYFNPKQRRQNRRRNRNRKSKNHDLFLASKSKKETAEMDVDNFSAMKPDEQKFQTTNETLIAEVDIENPPPMELVVRLVRRLDGYIKELGTLQTGPERSLTCKIAHNKFFLLISIRKLHGKKSPELKIYLDHVIKNVKIPKEN